MSNLFSNVLLPLIEVESWKYQREADLEVPLVFLPFIAEIELEYNTNQTRVVGCVSYYPNDIKIIQLPYVLNPLIYVVRIKTSQSVVGVSNNREMSGTLHFDVYMYSNPLLNIYKCVHMNEVGIQDWSVQMIPLDATDLSELLLFVRNTAVLRYTPFQLAVSSVEVERIPRGDIGNRTDETGLCTRPRLANRDVWDLISIYYPKITQTVTDHAPPGLVGRMQPLFPNIVPLISVTLISEGHLQIVRCLELCTGELYDAYFKTSFSNTQLKAVAVKSVAGVYSEFTEVPSA